MRSRVMTDIDCGGMTERSRDDAGQNAYRNTQSMLAQVHALSLILLVTFRLGAYFIASCWHRALMAYISFACASYNLNNN